MTYLEIINGVLRRLREQTVTTYNETEYSTMIGDYVNDAIDLVQQRHQWSAQFSEITVSTSASTQNYTIDGLTEFGQIMDAINDTSNTRLRQVRTDWMNTQTNMGGTEEGSPLFFSFNGTASDRDPKIDLWPIPDGTYSLKFRVFTKQTNVTAGATEVVVPAQPVIQYALASALRERGEIGGSNYNEQMAVARSVLSEHIAADCERFPELQMWDDGSRYKTIGWSRY